MKLITIAIIIGICVIVFAVRRRAGHKTLLKAAQATNKLSIANGLKCLKEKLGSIKSKEKSITSDDKKIFSNIAEGTHYGRITEILAEDLPWNHRLVSFVADGSGICINQNDKLPLGVVARAAPLGEHVSVGLLGCSSNTILITANSPVKRGEYVYTATNGTIQGHPQIPGSYYRIGIALTMAENAGTFVEVDPGMPTEIVIH